MWGRGLISDKESVEPTLSEFLWFKGEPSQHVLGGKPISCASPFSHTSTQIMWLPFRHLQTQRIHYNIILNNCFILFQATASLYASARIAFGYAHEPLVLLWAQKCHLNKLIIFEHMLWIGNGKTSLNIDPPRPISGLPQSFLLPCHQVPIWFTICMLV